MKLIQFLSVAICLTFLFSCGTITEEITLNKNGSGEYETSFDMMPMMLGFAAFALSMDSTAEKQSVTEMKEAIFDELPADEIDSIIVVSEDEYPDDIRNDPEQLAMVKRMENFMKASKSEGTMFVGIRFKFNDAEDFNRMLGLAGRLQNNRSLISGKAEGMDTETKYTYQKRLFSRSVSVLNAKELQERMEELSDEEIEDAELAELFDMENMLYRTVVNLPRGVKSVTGDGMVEKHKRRVVFENNLQDMFTGKANGGFEIKMKRR